MNKLVLKIFEIVKNITYFIKIVMMFYITLFLLYWIETLIEQNWIWLQWSTPIFDSINNFAAIFVPKFISEQVAPVIYEFFAGLIILIILAMIAFALYKGIEKLENLYKTTYENYLIFQENAYNKEILNKLKKEELHINTYKIFISMTIKNKIINNLTEEDLEKQKSLMNKYIIEKTGISPEVKNDGFLYTFNNFNDIDSVLECFNTLITTGEKAFMHYIYIQIFGENIGRETAQMEKMIDLGIANKLITASDTVFRYTYNRNCKFKTRVFGDFAFQDSDLCLHEFYKQEF